jgi:hypothetical protein
VTLLGTDEHFEPLVGSLAIQAPRMSWPRWRQPCRVARRMRYSKRWQRRALLSVHRERRRGRTRRRGPAWTGNRRTAARFDVLQQQRPVLGLPRERQARLRVQVRRRSDALGDVKVERSMPTDPSPIDPSQIDRSPDDSLSAARRHRSVDRGAMCVAVGPLAWGVRRSTTSGDAATNCCIIARSLIDFPHEPPRT